MALPFPIIPALRSWVGEQVLHSLDPDYPPVPLTLVTKVIRVLRAFDDPYLDWTEGFQVEVVRYLARLTGLGNSLYLKVPQLTPTYNQEPFMQSSGRFVEEKYEVLTYQDLLNSRPRPGIFRTVLTGDEAGNYQYSHLTKSWSLVGSGGSGGPVPASLVTVTNEGFTNQQEVDDALLYVPLTLSYFLNSHPVNLKGSTVEDVTLSWAYNKEVVSQTIASGSRLPSLRTLLLSGLSLTSQTSYGLSASDGTQTRNGTTTLYFSNEKRWGVATSGQGVEDLPQSDLLSSESRGKTLVLTMGSGEYGYYAFPLRLGLNPGNPTLPQATYTVGGFEGGVVEEVVPYTNGAGYTEDYVLAQTANPGLGTITLVVT